MKLEGGTAAVQDENAHGMAGMITPKGASAE